MIGTNIPCFRSLRPLVVALFPGQQRSLDRIREMRTKLSNELVELINEFGPQLYEDFNEVSLMLAVVMLLSADLGFCEVPYHGAVIQCTPVFGTTWLVASEEQYRCS